MNPLKKILTGVLLSLSLSAFADDCELYIRVVPPASAATDAPALLDKMLVNRLVRAVTSDGVVGDPEYGQLLLSGQFTDVYKQEVPGPPLQTGVHTTLTLTLSDLGGTVFATETFDLRGVGTSEQRAYINALQSISPRSRLFEEFIDNARQKTIAYFDNNYRQILQKARRAASMRDYEQALYYSTLIPQCSVGYSAAEEATIEYYGQYIDYSGAMLLKQARAAFAVSPNADGAREAYALLQQIDPASASEPEALKFAEEVRRQTKVEYDFEVHHKYNDDIDMEHRKIEAAKQVGVAFGRGQAANTTNILWK